MQLTKGSDHIEESNLESQKKKEIQENLLIRSLKAEAKRRNKEPVDKSFLDEFLRNIKIG